MENPGDSGRDQRMLERLARNAKLRADNTSGVRGVSQFRDKWHARIHHEGVTYHLGYFNTVEEAKAARQKAEQELYGDFARKDIA